MRNTIARTVAIVIAAIASFDRWIDAGAAAPGASAASFDANAAIANTATTRSRQVFIDSAVTIIVEVVADFNITTRTAADAFIGQTVAIVIKVVAAFATGGCTWVGNVALRPSAIGTTAKHAGTATDAQLTVVTSAAFAWKIFVDARVTIVIEIIANFGSYRVGNDLANR